MTTTVKSQITSEILTAARETAVLVDRSDLGMLKFSGESRLNLIHRMSTQAVEGLGAGEGAATVLTTDIGRIVDRLILYAGSDAVYALTGENNGDNVARYLMRFVFFNDDFHIEDLSAETAVFAVYGPQAETQLAAVGLPAAGLPLHHWREVDVAGVTAYLHRTDPLFGDGFFVMAQEADRQPVWSHLQATGLPVADENAFDYLHIANGRPRFGRELTQDYIPLEANLWEDVSFTKGCYIGQEIIARMESRGRLAKKLVSLRAEAPVAADTVVTADGKRAGTITSTAVGPDGPVALGYVKTAVLEADLPLQANGVPLHLVEAV